MTPIRHRKILDLAEENPDASLEEIASQVPSATIDLVEEVLNEHGDPAANGTSPARTPDASPDSLDGPPDIDDLSVAQQTTLKAIYDDPDATQEELADRLGVSRTTISKRIQSIEGVDWATRQACVETLFNGDSHVVDGVAIEQTNGTTTAHADRIDQLEDRAAALEQQVETLRESDDEPCPFDDPALAHRIVHACIQYEDITHDEERRLLKYLVT